MPVIPVIAVVGYHDSGKTTVVVNLVRTLKKRGYRVAAVKHAPHGYDPGPPGKDSGRYFAAGADKAVVAGPKSLSVHEWTDRLSLPDILARIDGMDFIVVEGFKREPGPKVGVFRKDRPADDLVSVVEGLIAVVSDYPVGEGLPCFSFEQTEELADFIVKYLTVPR